MSFVIGPFEYRASEFGLGLWVQVLQDFDLVTTYVVTNDFGTLVPCNVPPATVNAYGG